MFIKGGPVSTTWFEQSIGSFIFAHTLVPRMSVANMGYKLRNIGQSTHVLKVKIVGRSCFLDVN